MKRLTQLRPHVLILALAALVVVGARVAFRHQYARDLQRAGQGATDTRAREAEAHWKALAYVRASDPGFAESFLGKIDWARLDLSSEQAAKLRARLGQAVEYLVQPSVDGYVRLRTEGLRYQLKPNRGMHHLWTNALHRSESELSAEPLRALKLCWNSGWGGSNWVRGVHVTSVCLTNVAVATARSNTVAALLFGPVRKGFTSTRESLDPGFEYAGLACPPGGGSNAPLYLHLSFFAQSGTNGAAGPVYLSLSWLPEEHAWAACRILSDSWLGLHTPF